MSPLAVIIADRVNRKWLIVGSLFVWSGVTYGMGMAHTFDQIYWLRAIMGFSEALYIPAALSLIADYHTGKTRSLAIGIHMTGLYMGQAIGGFGATVAAAFSWNETFHWFGIIGIVYSAILVFFLFEKKSEKAANSDATAMALAKLRATAYGFMNMVGVFAGAGVTSALGKMTDNGDLGLGFAVLAGIVAIALLLQITTLKPKVQNME